MNPTISADKLALLDARMRQLGVAPADLEEQFVRSSGPGGQKVNKSSSCVVLRHRPTGLQVKCQTSRQQTINRFLARRLLLDKIERQQQGFVAEQKSRSEKIRRQKRRRSRRAKNRMLEDKSHQSAKKANRRRPAPDG